MWDCYSGEEKGWSSTRPRIYTAYPFLTSALKVVSGQFHAPATSLAVKETVVPIEYEYGWSPSGYGLEPFR
jgi:hypothetical protein